MSVFDLWVVNGCWVGYEYRSVTWCHFVLGSANLFPWFPFAVLNEDWWVFFAFTDFKDCVKCCLLCPVQIIRFTEEKSLNYTRTYLPTLFNHTILQSQFENKIRNALFKEITITSNKTRDSLALTSWFLSKIKCLFGRFFVERIYLLQQHIKLKKKTL